MEPQQEGRQVVSSQQENGESNELLGRSQSPPPFQLFADGGESPIQRQEDPSAVVQRQVDVEHVPGAVRRILDGGGTTVDNSSDMYPSYYDSLVPPEFRNILWNLYKAIHWESSFGQTAQDWAQYALQDLSDKLDLLVEPGADSSNPDFGNAFYMEVQERLIVLMSPPTVAETTTPAADTTATATPRTAVPGRAAASVTPDELAAIDEARSHVHVEALRSLDIMHVNPELIGAMPLKPRDSAGRRINPEPRIAVFGALLDILRPIALKRWERQEKMNERATTQAELDAGTARPARQTRLTNTITRLNEEITRLDGQIATLEGQVATARTNAQNLARAYFQGKIDAARARLTEADTALGTRQAEVDRLEVELKPKVVRALRLRVRIMEGEIALGGRAGRNATRDLPGVRSELTELESGLSPEERTAMPEVAALPEPVTARSLNPLRTELRGLTRDLRPLATARTQRDRAQSSRDNVSADVSPDITRYQSRLDIVNRGEITVIVPQTHYRGTIDGMTGSLSLTPVNPGFQVDRPQGHIAGGSETIPLERYQAAARSIFEDEDQQRRAVMILETWGSNEGRADSINTWDRAILTLGPGIAAAGVLQRCFGELYSENAPVFQSLFGQYGIGVTRGSGGYNLTVVVPSPPAGETVEPGAPAPGTVLTGREALEFMATDFQLNIAMRAAGRDPAWQEILARVAVDYSVGAAMDFAVQVRVDRNTTREVPWLDIVGDLPDHLVTASLAAISDMKHGSGNTNAAKNATKDLYARLATEHGFDPLQPNAAEHTMPREAREEMIVAVINLVSRNRRPAFVRAIPGLDFDNLLGSPAAPEAEGPATE